MAWLVGATRTPARGHPLHLPHPRPYNDYEPLPWLKRCGILPLSISAQVERAERRGRSHCRDGGGVDVGGGPLRASSSIAVLACFSPSCMWMWGWPLAGVLVYSCAGVFQPSLHVDVGVAPCGRPHRCSAYGRLASDVDMVSGPLQASSSHSLPDTDTRAAQAPPPLHGADEYRCRGGGGLSLGGFFGERNRRGECHSERSEESALAP